MTVSPILRQLPPALIFVVAANEVKLKKPRTPIKKNVNR
jgi:hypothetical protein